MKKLTSREILLCFLNVHTFQQQQQYCLCVLHVCLHFYLVILVMCVCVVVVVVMLYKSAEVSAATRGMNVCGGS